MAAPFEPKPDAFKAGEAHQSVLDKIFLPDAVIATKPNHESPVWSYGAERSLHHDCWLVGTSDPTMVRTRDLTEIRFDANLGYGRVSLSHPDATRDNLTKKVICARALSIGVIKGKLGALSTYRLCLSLDWFFRWRWDRGIACNRDLAHDDFVALMNKLPSGDLLSLVDITDRLRRLEADVEAGVFPFPSTSFRPGKHVVDWPKLAELLGVTRNSLSSSRRVRKALRGMIPRVAPAIAEDLLESLEAAKHGRDSDPSARKFEDWLLPWQYLFRLSETGWLTHDPLGFDPFEKVPLTVVAGEIGRVAERTRTLHPMDFGNLLSAAAKWVVLFSDHVIGAVAALKSLDAQGGDFYQKSRARAGLAEHLSSTSPAGCPAIAATWTRGGISPGSGALSMNEAIRHLLVSVGIVIACLAARRRIEVESLKAGCAREVALGVWNLETYIAKNLRDLDTMPVPSLIGMAVDVAERLSASTRATAGGDWILEVRGMSGKVVPVEWSDALNAFAELMDLPLPRGWSEWMLNFHQLRRGFAVFYYHAYRLSSLDALSHLLWHADPVHTRDYVFESVRGGILSLRENLSTRHRRGLNDLTEDERRDLQADKERLQRLEAIQGDWGEVRCEFVASRLLGMWTGDDLPVGKGAKRLFGELELLTRDLAQSVSIGPRSNDPRAEADEFVRRAKSWATSNLLEPVPGVPVHCLCRHDHPDDVEEAECERAKRNFPGLVRPESEQADRSPDMAFASTFVCLGCVHCAAFKEDRTRINGALGRLSDAKVRGASEAVREDATRRFDELSAAKADAEAAVTGSDGGERSHG